MVGGLLDYFSCVFVETGLRKNTITLPETNIAPENGWLEDDFPFGMACFQGLC